MSQLILDLGDPAVAEMVSQWEDGGTYRFSGIIRQNPGTGNLKPFDLLEITDYGDAGTDAATPTGKGLQALEEEATGEVAKRLAPASAGGA